MIDIRPFMPGDLQGFAPQQAQQGELTSDAMNAPFGSSWTALADGKPIGCAGLVEVWTGRAYAWALLSEQAGPHMLAITRGIRSRLSTAPFRRIEMAVAVGFPAGCRWAEMLGFIRETPQPMRAYLPDGRDAWLYAKVHDGNGNDGRADGIPVSGQRLSGPGRGG